jgi:hypothetical protein
MAEGRECPAEAQSAAGDAYEDADQWKHLPPVGVFVLSAFDSLSDRAH